MAFSRWSRCRLVLAGLLVVVLLPMRAFAVGYDFDDFIITGAPNFPDRIGVFDHDFTFKGYLDQSFLGVQGLDFDANGNLVAVASLSTNPEVRVYSPSGSRVGGFFTNNSMLQYTGDLKVAPDGNYAFGSYTDGVQVYTPAGNFVRQYGTGDSRGITYLPGNRLWSGGSGTTVKVFDTINGVQVGSFQALGQTQSYSMQYSSTTNSVLIVDSDSNLGGIFELSTGGSALREFASPMFEMSRYGVTRGPDGDVFATRSPLGLYHWNQDGSYVGMTSTFPTDAGVKPVKLIWAGIVPEPTTSLVTIGAAAIIFRRKREKSKGSGVFVSHPLRRAGVQGRSLYRGQARLTREPRAYLARS